MGEVLFDRLWSVREERKEERKGGWTGGADGKEQRFRV